MNSYGVKNKHPQPDKKESRTMCKRIGRLFLVLLGILCAAQHQNLWAHRCPETAIDTGKSTQVRVFVRRADGTFTQLAPGERVGVCSVLRLNYTLGYNFQPGNPIGAFEGGRIIIHPLSGSFSDDVPPVGGVPLIGPPLDCPGAVDSITTRQTVDFDVSTHQADIVGGFIQFRVDYGPLGTIVHLEPHLTDNFSSLDPQAVGVNPAPTCSIALTPQTICEGASATFTASQTGTGPFTYCWKKACPGAGECLSTANTLTINNAQLSDAGCYELTVTDRFGCTTTCQATLNVNPNPTCTIRGDNPVCPGTTHTYTSTVDPAGGVVTHSWSVDPPGCATINGPANGESVSVTFNGPGTCTLVDTITRDGCPGECRFPVTVNPNPTCTIKGDNPL